MWKTFKEGCPTCYVANLCRGKCLKYQMGFNLWFTLLFETFNLKPYLKTKMDGVPF